MTDNRMVLRMLDIKDAPLMHEWMHDPMVISNMKTDFQSKTIEDCEKFIRQAQSVSDNLHMAITNDDDEYMGTVSLKHISNRTAEFGITVRRSAMGQGYSKYGMEQIINKGFAELGLAFIYWCVDPLNERAIHFYDKNGYARCDCPDNVIGYSDDERKRFIWYFVRNP